MVNSNKDIVIFVFVFIKKAKVNYNMFLKAKRYWK